MLETSVKVVVLFANLILTAAYASAWWIFGRGISWGEASPVQVHLTVAGIGILFSLFANLCVIFYFVGTGVWMRDRAKESVTLDRERALRMWDAYEGANKLKGKAFPMPTMGLVLGLFAFILGGANQVGAIPSWLHPLIATLLVLCAWAAVPMVFKAMRTNLDLLNRVSAELDALS